MQSWPHFAEDEIDAVARVLRSGAVNYWTGEEVKTFEREFAAYHDRRYAIAVANGTLALELALIGLGIGESDEVIVTPRSFFASAGAVVLRGATPVFADVDIDSQNITADSIEAVCTERTRAILLVHHAGWPCDMAPITALAKDRDLKIIEDCAQAHGATCHGRRAGAFGDVSAFSFCQDKIMTTGGEGGFILTDDPEVWSRCWSYKDHGKSYEAVFDRQHPPGFRWLQEGFGSNWRLTEMQAAIGRSQLKKLPDWVAKRRKNAQMLIEAWRKLPALRVPVPPAHIEHAYYKFYAFVRPERLRDGWSRDRIMVSISQAGVPCLTGGCPEIYRETSFIEAGLVPAERRPQAKVLGETSLMFQVHPTLDESAITKTAKTVAGVIAEATA